MNKRLLAVAMTSAFAGAALAQSSVTAFGNDGGAAISLPGGPAGLGRGETSVGFEMGMRYTF